MIIDDWTRYEVAMEELLKRLGESHPLYNDAEKHKFQLLDFIRMDRKNDFPHLPALYESTDGLSAITKDVFHISFNEFVDQVVPPPLSDKYSIFLCYSKDDRALVSTLHKELEWVGFNPWLDEVNLLPGQDWEYEIRQAIKKSDFFLACLTKNSVNKRGYVQKEIRIALDILDEMPEGQIYLIPVRLEDCKVPERLKSRQWVDMFPDRNDGISKIIRAIMKPRL